MLRSSAALVALGALGPAASADLFAEKPRRFYLPSLHDRAKLAIHCLLHHTDVARGRLPYFYTRMSDHPPSMFLCVWSYGDGMGRSVDALGLLRQITDPGAPWPEEDRGMQAGLIGLLGADGLSWCPAEPWLMRVPHTRPTWLQQGTLLALGTLFGLTGEEPYRQYTENLIHALDTRLVRKPGLPPAFPGDVFTRSKGWEPPGNPPTEPFALYCASVTMPLLRYHRLSGSEPALRLASELVDGALQTFAGGEKLFELGHFHCQSRVVTSLLQRAALVGSAADFALGEKLYRKARGLGTQSGWFPEQINNPEHNRSNLSETCCLTDMLESAILLAQHVNPAYWHDVERFVRNHLLVHQMIDTGWEREMTPTPVEQHPLRFAGDTQPASESSVRGEQVMASLVGGFAGWGGVTALSDDSAMSNSNQHCCNAAGARALYDAWHYAVADSNGVLQINLHLTRNHAAAEVLAWDASEPGGMGGLRINVKQSRRIRVRIPEFVEPGELRASLDGQPVPLRHEGAFVDLGKMEPSGVIEILHPMRDRVTEEKIAPGTFRFQWRGATVVSATPGQKIRPLFADSRFVAEPPEPGPVPRAECEPL
jgi:hypothetical protein